MRPSKIVIVQIQHCENCHLHSWCSRHDENKYLQHTERVRAYAQNVFTNVDFRVNQPQKHYEDINQPTSKGQIKYFDHQENKIVNFPRFGSFEISVNGALVFSKLQSNLWPKHDRIAILFEKIHDEIEGNNNLQKYSLEYRLKNDQDQFFRQTYKKVIQRNTKSRQMRPLSQNHSQVIGYVNRSPSNALKAGNPNFISRKLHQSLRRSPFPQADQKHEFIKPYKAQIRSGSKGSKRPNTNQISRGNKQALQFNKKSQNYDFDSKEINQNDKGDELRIKGSPNPRRRLHILRDAISKPEGVKNNISPFNGNKEYLNVKARVKNVVNEAQIPPKKSGNAEKLPTKLHASNLIPKNNNWTASPLGLSPINDVSKKQPQRLFKRVALKNQQRLKLSQSPQIAQKSKVIDKNQQNAMQKSEERLIAKLEEDDIKEMNGQSITMGQKTQEQKQSEKQVHNQDSKVNYDNKVNELSKKEIKNTNQRHSEPSIRSEKSSNSQLKEYDEQFNDQKEQILKHEQKNLDQTNTKKYRKQPVYSEKNNHEPSSNSSISKNNLLNQQIVQNQQYMPEDEYQNEDNEDNSEEEVNKATNEDIAQQENQYQDQEGQERKKSTSIQNSLFNKPHNNQPSKVDAVKQTTREQFESQNNNLLNQEYKSEINAWSKNDNEIGDEASSEFKVTSNLPSGVIQGTSVKEVNKLITSAVNNKQQQQENYYEQEEIEDEQAEKIQKIKSMTKNDQPQEYEQELIRQIEDEQQQRPESRDSRSHSHRKKTLSVSSQRDGMNSEKLTPFEEKRDFVKKEKTFQKIQNQDELLENKQDQNQNYQEYIEDERLQDKSVKQKSQRQLENQNSEKVKEKTSLKSIKQTQTVQKIPSSKQLSNYIPEQQKQQEQNYDEDLQQVQESHHSIPIIVSSNDGTNKIIKDQVEKDLQQMYLRQEKQKQQRQIILQNMMKNDDDLEQVNETNNSRKERNVENNSDKQQSYDQKSEEGFEEEIIQNKLEDQQINQKDVKEEKDKFNDQVDSLKNAQIQQSVKDKVKIQSSQVVKIENQKINKFQVDINQKLVQQKELLKQNQNEKQSKISQKDLKVEDVIEEPNDEENYEEDVEQVQQILKDENEVSQELSSKKQVDQTSSKNIDTQKHITETMKEKQIIQEKHEDKLNDQNKDKDEQPLAQNIQQSPHEQLVIPTQNTLAAVQQYVENLSSVITKQQKQQQNQSNSIQQPNFQKKKSTKSLIQDQYEQDKPESPQKQYIQEKEIGNKSEKQPNEEKQPENIIIPNSLMQVPQNKTVQSNVKHSESIENLKQEQIQQVPKVDVKIQQSTRQETEIIHDKNLQQSDQKVEPQQHLSAYQVQQNVETNLEVKNETQQLVIKEQSHKTIGQAKDQLQKEEKQPQKQQNQLQISQHQNKSQRTEKIFSPQVFSNKILSNLNQLQQHHHQTATLNKQEHTQCQAQKYEEQIKEQTVENTELKNQNEVKDKNIQSKQNQIQTQKKCEFDDQKTQKQDKVKQEITKPQAQLINQPYKQEQNIQSLQKNQGKVNQPPVVEPSVIPQNQAILQQQKQNQESAKQLQPHTDEILKTPQGQNQNKTKQNEVCLQNNSQLQKSNHQIPQSVPQQQVSKHQLEQPTEKIIKNQLQSLNFKIASNFQSETPSLKQMVSEDTERIIRAEIFNINEKLADKNILSETNIINQHSNMQNKVQSINE